MFYTVDAKSGVSSSDNSTIDVMTQHAASVTVYSVVVTLLIVLTAVIIPATVSCTWRYSLGTCESFFFVRIESRTESAVYHASCNTA